MAYRESKTLAEVIAGHMAALEPDHGKLKRVRLEWEDGFVMDFGVNLTSEEQVEKFASMLKDEP